MLHYLPASLKSSIQNYTGSVPDDVVHNYLLLGKAATKEAILKAMKDIATKAAANDYFIFNFSGFSYVMTTDSVTFFFPYNVIYEREMKNRDKADTNPVITNLISLKNTAGIYSTDPLYQPALYF